MLRHCEVNEEEEEEEEEEEKRGRRVGGMHEVGDSERMTKV